METGNESTARDTIICVCTANVCRSPIAAALLTHALGAEGDPWRALNVVSAGVAATDGDPPSRNSVDVLRTVGIDISRHRSQRLSDDLMARALLVLVMTASHKQVIVEAFPDDRIPVLLFRELLPEAEGHQIPDPYGGNIRLYEATRDSMVEAIPSIVNYIKTLVPAGNGPH